MTIVLFKGPNKNEENLPDSFNEGYKPNTLVESKPINADLYTVKLDLDTVALAVDSKLSAEHTEYTHGVHGVGTNEGDVVGTTKQQTLTNKTINATNNTITNLVPATAFKSDYTIPWSKIVADTGQHTARITNADFAENLPYTRINTENQVSTSDLKASCVTTAKIADGAVTTAKIPDSNITTVKIANGNITTVKIADSNVTTDKIANSNITTDKIASGAVTTAKIADSNVTTAKLADNCITATKITSGVITNTHISSASADKIAYEKLNLTGKIVATDFSSTITIPVVLSGTSAPNAGTGSTGSFYFQYTS